MRVACGVVVVVIVVALGPCTSVWRRLRDVVWGAARCSFLGSGAIRN